MGAVGCRFCAGEIVSATFSETEHLRALYNLAPMLPGHCLIVPKRHVCRLSELGAAEGAEMLAFAAQIAGLVMATYGCTGYDLSLQEGEAAGQTVDHLHLHIIPRRVGDLNTRDWHSILLDSVSRRRMSAAEMAAEVTRLRRALANTG